MHHPRQIWEGIGRATAIGSLLAAAIGPAAPATTVSAKSPDANPAVGDCRLNSDGGNIQHVIYVQFDNTHFKRDKPNIASDLEQMPHLLSFINDNGTLLSNDHTILISHTAGGILSSLTGLYPDRNGINVSNSYGFFNSARPNGSSFVSAFKYWTDVVDAADTKPNLITDSGKNTPAPWVPYTRAGCDFGAVATANVVLENANTSPTGDIAKVFGSPSGELTEVTNELASSDPKVRAKPQTDFVGIAIHCETGQKSACASNANARNDVLPDEPQGYSGFKGLFGAKYVNPAITGGQAGVKDTAGNPIQDPSGNPGFPGFDGMSAAVSLGYVAQMQEAGVPVTFAYISDAHDDHHSVEGRNVAFGPGEQGYLNQLKAYDDAFAAFFTRLASKGIDKSNTLFVFTVDEGDHFAGGSSPNGSWSHTYCNLSVASPSCPSNQIGEVNLNVNSLKPSSSTWPTFDIHFDSAPTFYVKGQPGRTDPAVRQFERDLAAAQFFDPYVNPSQTAFSHGLADPVGEKLVHMVNADSLRTPTFTVFAQPDLFVTTVNNCAGFTNAPSPFGPVPVCVDYHFAWSHGDVSPDIANTWLGLVGPGVKQGGVDDTTWSDHTDARPTTLALLGLQDDYRPDGRVLLEVLRPEVRPATLHAHEETLRRLGPIYKKINAPFGELSLLGLAVSTEALKSGSSSDDSLYTCLETKLGTLTTDRDGLAADIREDLFKAEFGGQALNEQQAKCPIS